MHACMQGLALELSRQSRGTCLTPPGLHESLGPTTLGNTSSSKQSGPQAGKNYTRRKKEKEERKKNPGCEPPPSPRVPDARPRRPMRSAEGGAQELSPSRVTGDKLESSRGRERRGPVPRLGPISGEGGGMKRREKKSEAGACPIRAGECRATFRGAYELPSAARGGRSRPGQ